MSQMGFGIPTPNEEEEGGSSGSVNVVGSVEVANDVGNPLPVSGIVSVVEPVTVDGEVSLTAATLAALESINTTIANLPSDYPDAAALAKLDSILVELGQKLEAGQEVALSATTLSALETITAEISGSVGVTGPLTDAELRATAPAVKDDYQGGEVLADQVGAAGVLTFTFATPVNLILVNSNGASTDVARIDPFGGTPSASSGIPAGDEIPVYVPVTATVVKVYAPTGMVVSVAGFRRS